MYLSKKYTAEQLDKLPFELKKGIIEFKEVTNNFDPDYYSDEIVEADNLLSQKAEKYLAEKPKTANPQKTKQPAKNKQKKNKPGKKERKSAKERKQAIAEAVTTEREKLGIKPGDPLNQVQVLKIAAALQAQRGFYGVADAGAKHKRTLEPTEHNLYLWAKAPGKYDLLGIDAARDTATVDPAKQRKVTEGERMSFWKWLIG